ncbi:MAG: site-2 protease family protein, partial [Chloroflexi bacterium]|nr:site-2 protease family protein [Chloroflexota bacterium]
MLFSSIDLLLNDPLTFLKVFPVILAAIGSALLLGITVHEASHALVAFRLGDYTAKRLGRLTLNPQRHLDPTGALMLVIVGFGWGKPVPVNPYYLAGGRKGLALVSAAGPISNLISASLLAIPFKLDLLTPSMRFSSLVSFDNGV